MKLCDFVVFLLYYNTRERKKDLFRIYKNYKHN